MELGEGRRGWRGGSEGDGWRSKERKVLRKARPKEGPSGQETCQCWLFAVEDRDLGGRAKDGGARELGTRACLQEISIHSRKSPETLDLS